MGDDPAGRPIPGHPIAELREVAGAWVSAYCDSLAIGLDPDAAADVADRAMARRAALALTSRSPQE